MKYSDHLRKRLLLFLFCFGFCGCVSLKEVGDFSASSQKAFQDAGIVYGHYDYCVDSCYIFNQSLNFLKDLDCNCTPDKKMDTLFAKELSILASYYAGLCKLSGNALVNFAPIGQSISAGTYGQFTITSTESGVFNALSTVATNLVTVSYKNKKIKEIVTNNHKGVLTGVDVVLLQLDNLKSKIELMRSTNQTRSDVYLKKSSTEAEKWVIINAYKQKDAQIATEIAFYNNFYKTIQKVRDGEVLLMKNVDNLKDENFKSQILGLAGDIIYLNGNFKF